MSKGENAAALGGGSVGMSETNSQSKKGKKDSGEEKHDSLP